MYCIVLYCIVFYCTVVLYCIVLCTIIQLYRDLLSNISISRCGLTDDITEESFAAAQISFDEFSKNPELLTSADVVVRVDGK